MHSSSSLPNLFFSIPSLAVTAIQLLFICNVSSLNLTNTYLHHKCLTSQGKYEAGSGYEKDLNSLIRMGSESTFRNGFVLTSLSNNSASVTLMYQCRGDSYWSKCRPCFNAGIAGLRRRCPKNKGGIIWFDQCVIKITKIGSHHYINKIDYEKAFSLHNPEKVSGDVKLFNKETIAFLEKLTLKAIDENNKDDDGDGKIALYAAGEKMLGMKKLYAMVQCTKIINTTNCKDCLEKIVREYPKCCDGKKGGRALMGTSCNFRYELYPFLRTSSTH